MGWRELKQKYGKGNTRQNVQAAIRAEIVGGDDLMAALEHTSRLAERLAERGLAGADEAEAALDHLRVLREIMGDVIAERYGLQP